jgi:hypothetical protein
MRDFGSFQDGGLKENNPADIARQISRQIWPSLFKKAPALLISIGTGTELSAPIGQDTAISEGGPVAPHFRNVFKDGMARRARDAWLSSLDGQRQWERMINQVDDKLKPDYIRLNVPLRGLDSGIDGVKCMTDYRNLVITHRCTSRLVSEAVSALLASSFYFVLTSSPERTGSSFMCRGTIRCRPPIRSILSPLEKLQDVVPVHFITDDGTLCQFLGEKDICSACGRYCKPISFRVQHLNDEISIYLAFGRGLHRKISGFPDTMSSFINAQDFSLAFGTPYHDAPGTQPCTSCDSPQAKQTDVTRKRKPEESEATRPKKIMRPGGGNSHRCI